MKSPTAQKRTPANSTMKTIDSLILTSAIVLAPFARGAEPAAQADPASNAATSAQPGGTNSTAAPAPEAAATDSQAGTNMIRMNFRQASLDLVLSHLSEAAGFIINIK